MATVVGVYLAGIATGFLALRARQYYVARSDYVSDSEDEGDDLQDSGSETQNDTPEECKMVRARTVPLIHRS